MPYNNAIPQPTDRIKSSQNDLLQNFQSIYTLVGIDHVNFDDVSGNQGKHNTVSMPNYAPSGSPAASADIIKLFAKAVSGVTQMFILPETADTLPAERNITGRTTVGSRGEFILPCGVKVKWGQSTSAGTGLANINYTGLGLTDFTSTFAIYTTIYTNAGTTSSAENYSVRVYSSQLTNFDAITYLSSSNTVGASPFAWLALGV